MSLIQAGLDFVPPAMIRIMRTRDTKVNSIGVRMHAQRPSCPMIAASCLFPFPFVFFFFNFLLLLLIDCSVATLMERELVTKNSLKAKTETLRKTYWISVGGCRTGVVIFVEGGVWWCWLVVGWLVVVVVGGVVEDWCQI